VIVKIGAYYRRREIAPILFVIILRTVSMGAISRLRSLPRKNILPLFAVSRVPLRAESEYDRAFPCVGDWEVAPVHNLAKLFNWILRQYDDREAESIIIPGAISLISLLVLT
jgi:hypothetical protein